uniref:Mitochondrial carrier protein n=1 Tax=Globisporangium ultimum (strain ATCC 200006 / CBS 805.95 / DAOM BR144) TaxID=431595 RepID=K3WZ53_GLOUD
MTSASSPTLRLGVKDAVAPPPPRVEEAAGDSRKTKKLVTGALSGMISALAFQPLDVLRTHQQGAFGSATAAHKSSVFPQLLNHQQLITNEHPLTKMRAMWRGTSSTLIRVAGGAGLYFTTLDHCMTMFPNSAINTFLSGAFARTFAGCVMSPVTIVKARMEWQAPGTYRSNLQVFQHVVRDEGVRGLYRGMVPTLIRDVPFSGLYVLIYTRLKTIAELEFPQVPTYGVHFASGVVAGVLATTVVHPADVVKTRMQLSILDKGARGELKNVKNSLTLRQTVAKILSEEGWRGFKKGIAPRVLKRTLSTAVTWTIYEQLSIR